jgi:general secretion pathway protein D
MTKPLPRRAAGLTSLGLAGILLLTGGCATLPPPILPAKEVTALEVANNGTAVMPARLPASAAAPAAGAASGAVPGTAKPPVARLFETPAPPPQTETTATPRAAGTPAPGDPTLETAVALEQLPLPVFIDTVFASILKRNVSVDPSIAQRKELVSLKSGKAQTAAGLYEATKSVLKSFGINVVEYNGLVRVTPGTGNSGFVPEVRRGRSMPDVPAALRPVFQIVDVQTVSPGSIGGWLRTIFGQRIQVQDDATVQALVISGQSDDVAAAVETVRLLDQPTMRGRSSARIAPLFWSADEMAKRLAEILTAQGYSVATAAQAQAPIMLLPVPPLNSVIVFARNDEVLNHVLRWATEIDQPASGRGSAGYFTYAVRNLDAGELAKTLQEVMNPAAGATATPGSVRSRVVVNPGSNTLIIQGSPTEYQQWFGLLQELDRPPRSALVSVTIAEVRLNVGEQLGFEWMLKEFQNGGYNVNVSTLGAFGTAGIGGLSAVINAAGASSPRALLNALASTSRVRVLANPSVMARNGESAFIQVGSEVPVVTSQQATGNTGTQVPGGGNTTVPQGVLQTIQYRPTGVILRVKPVIHSGGRIDLDVEQEVSSAASTRTGVSASPTISTRRITTKLTVTDGATVLLGGLMQETASNSDTGVPLLKDVPLLGNLFKSRDDSRDRIELVVLITPYVIADEFEAQAITSAFKKQLSWDASTPVQTLRGERAADAPAAPAGAIDDAGLRAKPYLLPPPGATAPSKEENRRVNNDGATQTRPDFNAVPPALGTKTPPSTGATKPGNSPAAAGANNVPVTDPDVLRELQKTIKQK